MKLLDRLKINFVNILALLVVIGCFVYFFYISSNAFPTNLVKEISDIKIALITVLSSVMSYYFGASKKDKNETQETKTT